MLSRTSIVELLRSVIILQQFLSRLPSLVGWLVKDELQHVDRTRSWLTRENMQEFAYRD
jgi:hypothetical protein